MTSPVVASLALSLLAMRAAAFDIMSAAMKPRFMECPNIDDHLTKCRNALLSTPELSDISLDPDSPEHMNDYDMCMLAKLGVTMRETLVWCEHKGSLLPITDGLVVKIIDEFQVCLEKGEGPVVAPSERPSKVSFTSTEDDDKYASYRKGKLMHSEYSEEDTMSDHHQDTSEESTEYKSDDEMPTVHSLDNYDDADFGPENSMKRYPVDYAKMPPSYFYPRKEHGIGNETTADAALKATSVGIQTTSYPAR